MVDLNRAYSEVKSLPDEALQKELASPTGMIPGYLVMAEMDERKAIRRAGGGPPSELSMKDEMLAGPSRQYSRGGIIAQLNPFYSQMQGMQNPDVAGGLMQEQINQQSGGLPSLMSAQNPGAAPPPSYLSDLVPTPSNAAQPVPGYSHGGLASLRR